MRFDLKTPCKHCPFRTDSTAIMFSCRDRADEIEELAYREGFPCHESAEHEEDEHGGQFVFAANGKSQHCVGATIMFLIDGGDGNVPWENLPEEEQERIRARLDWKAPVYYGPQEFLDAYDEHGRLDDPMRDGR